jgi:hypothetical protein
VAQPRRVAAKLNSGNPEEILSGRNGGGATSGGWGSSSDEVCEAAASAAVDAAAEAAGRRARCITFRRARTAVAERGANGHLGELKSLSWKAGRLRRAAVAPADMPVAGVGWQQAPDGLEYSRVPARRWASSTDPTVVMVDPSDNTYSQLTE